MVSDILGIGVRQFVEILDICNKSFPKESKSHIYTIHKINQNPKLEIEKPIILSPIPELSQIPESIYPRFHATASPHQTP